ncbi:MAG: pyridoxamine 5'-phosphate oxidase family protein [Gammaproteobacteria bacterium]
MSITNTAELRAHYGEPSELVQRKVLPKLDIHCRNLIEASPFLVIATADETGRTDASPRGDSPGFVAVLDEHTLLLPDRPGNRRLDTHRNILANPHVGLIFFIPGMNETLRVNGRAELITDKERLASLAVRGKLPLAGLLIHIEEAFLHCAKALIRSDLWNSEKHIPRSTFPSMGKMIADQISGIDAEEAERVVQESIEKRLY